MKISHKRDDEGIDASFLQCVWMPRNFFVFVGGREALPLFKSLITCKAGSELMGSDSPSFPLKNSFSFPSFVME